MSYRKGYSVTTQTTVDIRALKRSLDEVNEAIARDNASDDMDAIYSIDLLCRRKRILAELEQAKGR